MHIITPSFTSSKLTLRYIFTLFILLCMAGKTLASQFNVLLFTKTTGFRHTSINAGVSAFKQLSKKHHFTVQWYEDANKFNDAFLKQFDAVVFLLTTGDILNKTQQAAFERFIQSGKGFVGIHSASATEYNWPWFTQLVGRSFHIHPPIQTARISVINNTFPGLERMPASFLWTDEFYEFGNEKTQGLNYLLTVDEQTYNPKANWPNTGKSGNGMGEFHPLAWYHFFDGGRSFYTSLGHLDEAYLDRIFLEHIYGGLYWAATSKGMHK